MYVILFGIKSAKVQTKIGQWQQQIAANSGLFLCKNRNRGLPTLKHSVWGFTCLDFPLTMQSVENRTGYILHEIGCLDWPTRIAMEQNVGSRIFDKVDLLPQGVHFCLCCPFTSVNLADGGRKMGFSYVILPNFLRRGAVAPCALTPPLSPWSQIFFKTFRKE